MKITDLLKLCDEAIRDDERATPGPWQSDLDLFDDSEYSACVSDRSNEMLAVLGTGIPPHVADGLWTDADSCKRDDRIAAAAATQAVTDAAAIAAARTREPVLARALREVLDPANEQEGDAIAFIDRDGRHVVVDANLGRLDSFTLSPRAARVLASYLLRAADEAEGGES